MKENFDRFFDLTVMRFEGGSRYTNDADDPGGETKYGISKRSNPDLDIANLTKDEAKELWRERYWGPAGCDDMTYPWDLIVGDTAANLGVSRAKRMQDGAASPEAFHMARIEYYANLVAQETHHAEILPWMDQQSNAALERNQIGGLMKRKLIAALVVLTMIGMIGCALNSTALKPSQELLVRFETFYMATFNDYQTQVAQPGLTATQKDTLKSKRAVLVKVEPLLKLYGATVYAGGTPDLATEQQIIQLLNSIGGGF